MSEVVDIEVARRKRKIQGKVDAMSGVELIILAPILLAQGVITEKMIKQKDWGIKND